jgi:hypothetical protein
MYEETSSVEPFKTAEGPLHGSQRLATRVLVVALAFLLACLL